MFSLKFHFKGGLGVLSPGKILKFRGPNRPFGSKNDDLSMILRRFHGLRSSSI